MTALIAPDLRERSDDDRAAVALGARRRRRSRSTHRWPSSRAGSPRWTGQPAEAQRWAGVVDAASFELAPVDGSASFDSARAMLRALMCTDGPERDAGRRELRGRPRSRSGACGGTPPSALSGEAHLLTGDVDRAAPLFAEASNVGADVWQHRQRSSSASPSSRCWPWTPANGRRLTSTSRSALAIDRRATGMHDYAIAVLAFAARPGWPCTGATSTRRAPPAGAGRCGPDRCARSRCRGWPCGSGCSSPRCTSRWPTPPTARHLLREIDDILRHRPNLGTLVDEVNEFRQTLRPRPCRAGTAGGPPLSPAELRLLPYLQTHLTDPRDRRAAVRVAQHRAAPRSARSTASSASRPAARRCSDATTIGLLGA